MFLLSALSCICTLVAYIAYNVGADQTDPFLSGFIVFAFIIELVSEIFLSV